MDSRVERCSLTRLTNCSINFLAGFFHHFFDSCGVDSSVGDELFEGYAGNLTSDGVKARYRDSLGSVVDDEVNSGERFDSADVSAFASDDSALHFFTRERNCGYRNLGNMVGGASLDCECYDVARFFVRGFLEFFFKLDDSLRLSVLDFAFKLLYEVCGGFFGCHSGNSLKLRVLLFLYFFNAFVKLRRLLELLCQAFVLFLKSVGFSVERFFL